MNTALATCIHYFIRKKKSNRPFNIAGQGLADLRLDGCDGWMRPRDSQRQPGSPQGMCVHAKPNRDCVRPQSTQQVVRLPDSPGLSCCIVPGTTHPRVAARHYLTGYSLLAVSPCFGLPLPATSTCPCARARPSDRLWPPVVRMQVRRTQLDKGYLEGPGPARPLMGRTVSPEVNLDAKLLIPKSSAAHTVVINVLL